VGTSVSCLRSLADTPQANLDDRVKNPDQMITHDIQKFSNHLAAIYSNLAKPTLDVILYNYQLSQNVGAEGLVLLTVLVQLSAALRKDSCITLLSERLTFMQRAVRKLTPPFGAYTSMSAHLLGALRHTHSRLVEFAEEIAFYRGEETEKMLVEREYAGLIMHENSVLVRRWWHGCVEEGIVKWLWGSFGASSVGVAHESFAHAVGIACHLCNPCLLQTSWNPQHRFGGPDRK
jgi:ATP-binding cassette subfamily D (ALD) long-chain fatty acid import protein